MKKGSTEWYRIMTVKLNTVNIEMKEMRITWYEKQMQLFLEQQKEMLEDVFNIAKKAALFGCTIKAKFRK